MTDQPGSSTVEEATAGDRPIDLLALARLMLAETSLGTEVMPQEESQHRSGSREIDVQHSASQSPNSAEASAHAQPTSEADGKTASAAHDRGTSEQMFVEPVAPPPGLLTGPGLIVSSSIDASPVTTQLKGIVAAINSLPEFWTPSYGSSSPDVVLGVNPQTARSYNGHSGDDVAPLSRQADPNQVVEKRPSSEARAESQSDPRLSDGASGVALTTPTKVEAARSTQPITSMSEVDHPVVASPIGKVEASPVRLMQASASAGDAAKADAINGTTSLRQGFAQDAVLSFALVNDVVPIKWSAADLPITKQQADNATIATTTAAEASATRESAAGVTAPDHNLAKTVVASEGASTTDTIGSIAAPALTDGTESPAAVIKIGGVMSPVAAVAPVDLVPSAAAALPTGASVSPPMPAAPDRVAVPVIGAETSLGTIGAVPPIKVGGVTSPVAAVAPVGPAHTQPAAAAVPPTAAGASVSPSTPAVPDRVAVPVVGTEISLGTIGAVPPIKVGGVTSPVAAVAPTGPTHTQPAAGASVSPSTPTVPDRVAVPVVGAEISPSTIGAAPQAKADTTAPPGAAVATSGGPAPTQPATPAAPPTPSGASVPPLTPAAPDRAAAPVVGAEISPSAVGVVLQAEAQTGTPMPVAAMAPAGPVVPTQSVAAAPPTPASESASPLAPATPDDVVAPVGETETSPSTVSVTLQAEAQTGTPAPVAAMAPAGSMVPTQSVAAAPPTPAGESTSPSTSAAPDHVASPVGGVDASPSVASAAPPAEALTSTDLGSGTPPSEASAAYTSDPDASHAPRPPPGVGVVAQATVAASGLPNSASSSMSTAAGNDDSTPPMPRGQADLPDVDYPVTGDVQYDGVAPEISSALRSTILEWLNTAHADLSAEAADTFVSAPQTSYLDILLADDMSARAGHLEATASPMPSASESGSGPAEPFSHALDSGLN